MLKKTKALVGYSLAAEDGTVGTVDDMLFDQESWVLRYLVVKTGKWLSQRRVLISLQAVDEVREQEESLGVTTTRSAVRESPDISTEKPVSRESELLLTKYWQWAPYWLNAPVPEHIGKSIRSEANEEARAAVEDAAESHLRSTKEVAGYHVRAEDGEIGHVDDLVVEVRTWAIRYAVIDTRNWLPGKHVLLSPRWIREIRWAGEAIKVDVRRTAIEDAPPYDDATPITRAYEEQVHKHYARERYWEEE